jgi:hypothetical protein
MMFDYPTNNILHDIVLNLFLLLCEQDDEDVLMDIFVNSDLLEKIGSIWSKFCADAVATLHDEGTNSPPDAGKPKPNIYSWPNIETEEGKSAFWCFFGHVAILSNMIAEICDKPALNELIDVSELWKKYTEPNLDSYNLLMVEATSC